MKHVETIKALLRLARDRAASPAEAALALNRALELIAKHNIDIATLDLDGPTERLVNERVHVGERISQIKFLVAGILQEFFHCRICISRPHLRIVGRESDVTIATYVFDFLVRAASSGLRDYCVRERKARRKITGPKRANYTRGWIYAVSSNLRPPVAEISESGPQP